MKIVLIPWCLNNVGKEVNIERVIPLGLLSISAELKKKNYQCLIIDYNLPRYSNLSMDDFAKVLLSENADIYGFSVAAGVIHTSLELAEMLKRSNSSLKIVFGGPQATLTAQALLKNFIFIDYISLGEGEKSFVDLVEAIVNNNVDELSEGIALRDEKRNIIVKKYKSYINNLDALPIPDYESYPINEIVNTYMPIEVGRGCPYNCSFCSGSVIWGQVYRTKSVNRILHEISLLKCRYNVHKFYFRHDQILRNESWIKELCLKLKTEHPDIKWQCSARIDTISEKVIELMSQAGCCGIEYGIETGSKKIQKTIGKGLDINEIIKKIVYTISCNISPVLFFMCGFPEEDLVDIENTLDLILALSYCMHSTGFIQMRTLVPFPGTRIVEKNKQELFYDPDRLSVELKRKYSYEQIECAKKDFSIFPEFYSIRNKNGIASNEFVELERFATRIIQFCNLNMSYSFKIIIGLLDLKYKKLRNLWEEINGKSWTDDTIGEFDILFQFEQVIMNLGRLYDLPEWVKELYSYEKKMYLVRIKPRKFCHATKDWHSLDKNTTLVVNPNLKYIIVNYNLREIISNLKFTIPLRLKTIFSKDKYTILFIPYSKVGVRTHMVKGDFFESIKEYFGSGKYILSEKSDDHPLRKLYEGGIIVEERICNSN